MSATTIELARWTDGDLPANVSAGPGTVFTGKHAFRRFRSRREQALQVGRNSMLDAVHFALGNNGELEIGDYCCFTSAVLLCELRISIGSYVSLGWNATIADSDFHPIAPAERMADAIACSPASKGMARPKILMEPVVIEDYVWIGPNATILKGVRIGAGAIIEPGSLITRDVPPRARVLGNPARVIGEV